MERDISVMSYNEIRLPAEWEPHAFCLMAWAIHREWGMYADAVRRELHEVIITIAEYDTVYLLTPSDQIPEAKRQSFGPNVEILSAPVDDIWMRDIAPTFAVRGNGAVAIDWNFNCWGSTRRARPGDSLARSLAARLGLATIRAPFVAEGGAFVTDGEGTVIVTKSCLLNENRNPRIGRSVLAQMEEIERGFSTVGGRKIIWLQGDVDEPFTNGHADGYLLFTKPGAILVEAPDPEMTTLANRSGDIDVLQSEADSRGGLMTVSSILPPRRRHWRFRGRTFAPSYLNAYLANGAVITGKFGDTERDEAAHSVLRKSFPSRDIRMLSIDHIALGGGGIHCITQPMPSTSRK
ncbi:agmatine deiminase family protein [Bradyrhizobium liaoningense]|uniref:agmatine deiminase family protein n=1 Tax=Bradyrhizobium liaoningense TaxID=43992 RepID=UPI001BA783EB|nr:agmatine deiminase family protein [Bradyrhizobium liaoningense]MBR0838691.1 agmatine deiminase family protein [Bradyrhizobium liaoningense]